MKNQNSRSTFTDHLISINTAVFALFFLLLPLIYTHQVFETASLPRHILSASIACLLLFIYSIQIFLSEKKVTYNYLHIAIFTFLGWALLSALWSSDIKNTVIELSQLLVYFIILFFASQLQKEQIKNIFTVIFISASLAAIIGILQAFNLNPLELKLTTPLASTFNNKNHASVYFDLVIPLALVGMLTTKGYRKHIASITYTLAVTYILLTRTKGSLLGYFIFTLFFIVFIYRNKPLQNELLKKKKVIHYIILSFVIPAFVYTLTTFDFTNSHTPKAWNTGLTASSNSIRLSWYKNAYVLLNNNPLIGVGYGGFRKSFSPYISSPNIIESMTEGSSIPRLHNDPYQNFIELGFIGGGLIIIIFSYIIFKGATLLSSGKLNNKGSPNYLFLGIYLALVSSITHSFVDFPLRLPSSAVLFWFLTGISLLLINRSSSTITLKNNKVKLFVGIFVLSLSLLLHFHSYDLYSRFFSASKLAYNATVSIKRLHNCSKAKAEIDQALELYFADHFIRHRYAQIYSFCDLPTKDKLSAMNHVLNYDSTHNRARLYRAQIYLDNKELRLAQTDFDYLTTVFPHRPAAYLGLGDIATLKKDYSTARKYYEKAKILEPKSQKANFMLDQFNEKGI